MLEIGDAVWLIEIGDAVRMIVGIVSLILLLLVVCGLLIMLDAFYEWRIGDVDSRAKDNKEEAE